MTEAAWSRSGGADCIRLTGVPAGADVRVFPGTAGPPETAGAAGGPASAGGLAPAAGLPSAAGRLVRDGADLCFVPRFAFLDGTAYTVTVDGTTAAVLVPALAGGLADRVPVTHVTGIHPTAAEVPCNLLRFYIWFSAPMSEGCAAEYVRLAHDDGDNIAGALLPTEHELWDAARRRLTVLLDPARIKRGLAGHAETGYPLRAGEPFRLLVGSGFRDATGLPLRAPAQRRYHVGGEERHHVDPGRWVLTPPPTGSSAPLRVTFDRPLDHGLLARCLRVSGPDGQLVDGTAQIGHGEQSWQLVPHQTWAAGAYQLAVDPILEDLAGNSVSRVFDRDLTCPEDQPRPTGPATIGFRPR